MARIKGRRSTLHTEVNRIRAPREPGDLDTVVQCSCGWRSPQGGGRADAERAMAQHRVEENRKPVT